MTTFSLLMYNWFFSRHRVFYNYFRKPTRYRFTPYVKKGSAILMLTWSWMIGLNFIFEKRIPMHF